MSVFWEGVSALKSVFLLLVATSSLKGQVNFIQLSFQSHRLEPSAGQTAPPVFGLGRGRTFCMWKPQNGSYVLFGGLHQPAQGCSHCVAHERVFTSQAGRELVCLQQRRLPLWLLKKACVCLSKQNFPAYLEEGGHPPARKEQGSVWFKREEFHRTGPSATALHSLPLSQRQLLTVAQLASPAVSHRLRFSQSGS